MWNLVWRDGVECVEFDGYEIERRALRVNPGFWVRHVSEKAWATPELLDELRSLT